MVIDLGGQGREQLNHSPRAVHDQVGRLGDAGRLGAGAGHGAAGDAVGPERADGGEGGQVPEVIAAEQDRTGRALGRQVSQRGPLVHARRAQLDDQASGFGGQPEPPGQRVERAGQPAERAFRVGRAAGVHGHRERLVLDPGAVGRVRRPEQAGQGFPGRLHRGRRRRVGQFAVVPALAAVVAEHHQAGDGREAAQGDRVGRGPAGDDRDRAHRLGQRGQGGYGAWMGAGVARAGHDRRQRAVEVRGHQRAPRVRE